LARRDSSRIHRGLTGARELVGTRYLADAGLRREYAAEIAPRTGAALGKILAELYPAGAAAPGRALDLGAGTGAAGAALRARFGDGLQVVSVDRVAAPGIVPCDLARELPRLEGKDAGKFDLIVAAHLLGELFLDQAPVARAEARVRRVLAWCRELLAPGGTALLIEPALRETSRGLLEVRDRLVAAGLHVVAPCFWVGPCPALARERDWCHDATAAPAGVPGARVDFSWIALEATRPAPAPPTRWRVVSDRLVEKGRLKVFACGAEGRHAVARLDRAASRANAAFEEIERGEVVTIAGARVAGDGLRVESDTVVARPPVAP
jgi:SAM-dependent methyltransferase